jgi:hypothetical protein
MNYDIFNVLAFTRKLNHNWNITKHQSSIKIIAESMKYNNNHNRTRKKRWMNIEENRKWYDRDLWESEEEEDVCTDEIEEDGKMDL